MKTLTISMLLVLLLLPLQATTKPPKKVTIQHQLLNFHNKIRKQHKLPPMRMNHQLVLAADRHAKWMVKTKKYTHIGANNSTPAQRAVAAGFPSPIVGENIVAIRPTVVSAMRSWMKSPGHRKNILNPSWTHFGFSKRGDYWVAMFGKLKSAGVPKTRPKPKVIKIR